MANELVGTVINMKSLSQDISDPIIIGAAEANGRYLRIIFTQEAAAQFAPATKVYLSWKHIQKDVRGYNVFTEIPREDTDELTAEEQPPTWQIKYPQAMLHEGDVIANIELVDDISISASVSFNIHILADPNDNSAWVETDDYSVFKEAVVDMNSTVEKGEAQIQKQQERFDRWAEKLAEIIGGDDDDDNPFEIIEI